MIACTTAPFTLAVEPVHIVRLYTLKLAHMPLSYVPQFSLLLAWVLPMLNNCAAAALRKFVAIYIAILAWGVPTVLVTLKPMLFLFEKKCMLPVRLLNHRVVRKDACEFSAARQMITRTIAFFRKARLCDNSI